MLLVGSLFLVNVPAWCQDKPAPTNSFTPSSSSPRTTYYLRVLESPSEKKSAYIYSLLELALEYTRHSYGNYEIRLVEDINKTRAQKTAEKNTLHNFLFVSGYSEQLARNLRHSQVPISQGPHDYKICFCHKDNHHKFSQILSLRQLKQYQIGQRANSSDTAILKENGFNVVEIKNHSRMFQMLARKRFDLLCRSKSDFELDGESLRKYDDIIEQKSFAMYYPSPQFFWSNKGNHKALERINTGLRAAFKDGSLQRIFNQTFLRTAESASIVSRRIFQLHNRHAQHFPASYAQYYQNLHTRN